MDIESVWKDDKLITTVHEWIPVSMKKIIHAHTIPSYGKMLGIEYSFFQRRGNHIICTFSQKVGPLSFEMKFEKIIERRSLDETRIFFKTFESKADMYGWYSIEPALGGSHVTLRQETTVPRYLRWLPIKSVIESKIRNVYDALKKL